MSTPVPLLLPVHLRAARVRARLTQRELAVRAGTPVTKISDLEHGRQLLRDRRLLTRLAVALRMDEVEHRELLCAAEHDIALSLASNDSLPSSVLEVLSQTLRIRHALTEEEFAGLARYIGKVGESKRLLSSLHGAPT